MNVVFLTFLQQSCWFQSSTQMLNFWRFCYIFVAIFDTLNSKTRTTWKKFDKHVELWNLQVCCKNVKQTTNVLTSHFIQTSTQNARKTSNMSFLERAFWGMKNALQNVRSVFRRVPAGSDERGRRSTGSFRVESQHAHVGGEVFDPPSLGSGLQRANVSTTFFSRLRKQHFSRVFHVFVVF